MTLNNERVYCHLLVNQQTVLHILSHHHGPLFEGLIVYLLVCGTHSSDNQVEQNYHNKSDVQSHHSDS